MESLYVWGGVSLCVGGMGVTVCECVGHVCVWGVCVCVYMCVCGGCMCVCVGVCVCVIMHETTRVRSHSNVLGDI